jgi:adenine-specific DNA glycosylase
VAHHWLILHGRYVCVARSPKCAECGLQQACKYFAKHFGRAAAEEPKLPVVSAASRVAASRDAVSPAPAKKVKIKRK